MQRRRKQGKRNVKFNSADTLQSMRRFEIREGKGGGGKKMLFSKCSLKGKWRTVRGPIIKKRDMWEWAQINST